MTDNKEYLTKEKFEELSKELEYLKKDKRKEVAENLEYAKSLGDLSENAEYHEARESQANLEERIMKLDQMLKSAVIVSQHHSEAVGVGTTVVVQKEADKKTATYKIVGSEEADVRAGKISINSPLGEALRDKRKGDAFSFSTPGGVMKYKVVDIE